MATVQSSITIQVQMLTLGKQFIANHLLRSDPDTVGYDQTTPTESGLAFRKRDQWVPFLLYFRFLKMLFI